MIDWIVVGIGDISRKRVLPAILAEERSRLAGLVTRDPGKAEAYGVPAWTELEEPLAATDAAAVYVATPVFLHAEETVAALRAGRHVLCEKPMALNYGQAEAMVRAADESGRTLGIAYYRRMYGKVARARELLAVGAIGRPVLAEATSHGWLAPADGPWEWRGDPPRAGAGPLFDIGSHRIDLMNYLFGAPARASAHLSTLVQPLAVEDNATVLVEYECGVRGVVDVRWHSHIERDEFRIRGTEGEMDLTPLNGPELVYPGGVERIPAPDNLHFPAIEDFVSAALEGREPRSSGRTALPAEWALNQALASAAD